MSRLEAAQALLAASPVAQDVDTLREALSGLAADVEERTRINVGLIAETAALRAKARQPETIDLTQVSAEELLAEIARRLP